MKTMTAKEWNDNPNRAAWLWVEIGEGELVPVRYIRADWWIVTGRGWATLSYCCHPGTKLYIGTEEEAKGEQNVLRDALARRRAEWSARAIASATA